MFVQSEWIGVRLLRGAKVSEFLGLTNPIQRATAPSRDRGNRLRLHDLTYNT